MRVSLNYTKSSLVVEWLAMVFGNEIINCRACLRRNAKTELVVVQDVSKLIRIKSVVSDEQATAYRGTVDDNVSALLLLLRNRTVCLGRRSSATPAYYRTVRCRNDVKPRVR